MGFPDQQYSSTCWGNHTGRTGFCLNADHRLFGGGFCLFPVYLIVRKNSSHNIIIYTRLILSGKLYEHLSEIDTCCSDRMDRMIHQMAETEGVNEKLKASDQLGWISRMNSIRHRVEEILLNELVFDWAHIAASSGAVFLSLLSNEIYLSDCKIKR